MRDPAQPTPDEHVSLLLRRMARGDEAALEGLYASTARKVYGLALRILRQAEDAEEAALDVYSQAWRTAGDYDPRRGSALAWLLAMTRTRAIDRLRGARAAPPARALLEREEQALDEGLGPAERAATSESAGRVQLALASISDEQRLAISAAYYSGLTHAQIARELGIPLGTVKRRIRGGLERLRRILMTHREGVA